MPTNNINLHQKLHRGTPMKADNIEISDKKFLAAGGFGSVFKVKVKLNNEELDQSEWVVKEFHDKFFPEEWKIQSRYYYTFEKTTINGENAVVSEFIPGKCLSYYDTRNLDYSQRLTIVCQIAEQLNQYHHFTPKGKPFVHGDVRDDNINIYVDKNNNINAYILDFGLSIEHDNEDPNQLDDIYQSHVLNQAFFPPEALGLKHCFKTDIYLFANAVRNLYIQPPIELSSLATIISSFHHALTDDDYKNRPDSEEVLKFFLTLNRLYLLKKQNIPDEQLEIALKAKLYVLEARMWHDEISANDQNKEPIVWSDFDFEGSPEIAATICNLGSSDLLKSHINNLNKILLANPDVPAAINHLISLNLIHYDEMNMLASKPNLSKKLKEASRDEVMLILYEKASCGLSADRINSIVEQIIKQSQPDDFDIAVLKTLIINESARINQPTLDDAIKLLSNQNLASDPVFLSRIISAKKI